jgi:hypothetical protein
VTTPPPEVHPPLARTAARIFAANDRMNQMLIERLDPATWRAKPPGNARTIAAIFTHLHNVRTELLAEALGPGGRIAKFHRDGWASPWPAGLEMLCYMLAHEAHHRGQGCLLAGQLGYPLPKETAHGIWNWEKLWKECGSPRGPGYDS